MCLVCVANSDKNTMNNIILLAFTLLYIPCGLVAMISGFHQGGSGSILGGGDLLFYYFYLYNNVSKYIALSEVLLKYNYITLIN